MIHATSHYDLKEDGTEGGMFTNFFSIKNARHAAALFEVL